MEDSIQNKYEQQEPEGDKLNGYQGQANERMSAPPSTDYMVGDLTQQWPSSPITDIQGYAIFAAVLAILSTFPFAILIVNRYFGSRAAFCLWLAGIVAYMPSYLDGSEKTGKRVWPAFAQHPFWRWVGERSKWKILLTTPLRKNKQYLFVSHPHGVMSMSHGMYLSNGANFHALSPLPERNDVAAPVVFRIPIWREMCLWWGCVTANAKTARQVLSKGRSLVTIVGGMDEQILNQHGSHSLYLKQRVGFAKLALEHGVPIIPIYVFGENDLYYTSSAFLGIRQWILRTFGACICISWGRSKFLPFLPLRVPLTAVFGAPLEVEKKDNPSSEETVALHAKYMEALKELFDSWKAECGYPHAQLIIN